MLKILRKRGVAKKILWFLAVIIIISFVFFGAMTQMDNSKKYANYAGKIFNKKVSYNDFAKAYAFVKTQALIQYRDKFNTVSQYLNLTGETWDRLILLYEAKKRNIKVTNQEIIDTIQTYEFFMRNGKFDNKLYEDILQFGFKTTPRQFEENVRDNIKISKLYLQETDRVKLSENKILEEYKNQNEQVQVSYAFIATDKFIKDVAFFEESAKAYYEENKYHFTAPPSIKLEYISLPFPPRENTPDNTDMSSVEESEKNIIIEKADKIYYELSDNKNLKEVAEKNNATFNETDYFSMEQPDLSFGWSYESLMKIFQFDINEISEPIETPNGIYIVKMKEKRAAYIPEYDEIKGKIKDAYQLNEAEKIAKEKAEEYAKSIRNELAQTTVKDFPKTVKNLGLEIIQTPAFKRGQYLPVIGISNEFQDAAFSLLNEKELPLSQAVKTAKGFAILYLDSYIPFKEDIYQKDKQAFTEKLTDSLKNEAFVNFLTRLRTEANLLDNVTKEQQAAKAKTGE